jgi:protein-L-isoaspartate(D-aspartate) O-methyltransferase
MKISIPSIIAAVIFSGILMILFKCGAFSGSEDNYYKSSRSYMVSRQLQGRGITDKKVLEAMKKVPRHEFVPAELKNAAYQDGPLPIGYGQTISQPYIVALMTELLALKKNSRVLEVGTGSGYQAAILAEISKEVYTVEIVKGLHESTNSVLKNLGYTNIKTKNDDGYFGWEEYAPFDAIIVTCASEFVPPPLIKQLKKGGVMCIPVGPPFKVQHLLVVRKTNSGEVITDFITQVRFVPLIRKGD